MLRLATIVLLASACSSDEPSDAVNYKTRPPLAAKSLPPLASR
jgi:hypothetical protein